MTTNYTRETAEKSPKIGDGECRIFPDLRVDGAAFGHEGSRHECKWNGQLRH